MKIWLDCLIHDDRNIRWVAIQALECVLKVCRSPRPSSEMEAPTMEDNPHHFKPGLRKDNLWLQYDPNLQQDKAALKAYYSKPFLVKSYPGFYAWPKGRLKMRVSSDQPMTLPDHISHAVVQFFSQPSNMDTFMKFVTMEHKKGEDYFSTDKAYFYSMLFEGLAPELSPLFMPKLKVLCESDQESEQRAAAEIVYGIMSGTRFHSFKFCEELNQDLESVLRSVLVNVTTETIGDWENVFASSKVDPNRVGWMYELLLENLAKIEHLGAFRASALLRLLNKAIIQNWKARDLQVMLFV